MSAAHDIADYVLEIQPKAFAVAELTAWSQTVRCSVGRDQWEPCILAWAFSNPTPRGENRLVDLGHRLRALGRSAPTSSGEDGWTVETRCHAIVECFTEPRRVKDGPSLRSIVEQSRRVYGEIHWQIVLDVAEAIRFRSGLSDNRDKFDLMAKIVGHDLANQYIDQQRALGEKVKHRAKSLSAIGRDARPAYVNPGEQRTDAIRTLSDAPEGW